jgi:hypothetical protein
MKHLLFLLIPIISFAQPKKATKIIIANNDTAIIQKIATILYENGYTVESKDRNFIASTEKNFSDYSVKIRALTTDSTVTFTGVMAINATIELYGVRVERTFDPINYSGAKKSPLMKSWKELESIAKKTGSIIKYE